MKYTVKLIYSIILVAVVAFVFIRNYNSASETYASTGATIQMVINDEISFSNNFIETLAVYGNNYFRLNAAVEDEQLFSLLKYDPVTDSYNMDAVADTPYKNTTGNLTGIGSIPAAGKEREELYLALNFNIFFSKLFDRLPDAAWVYYTSDNSFINIYPWVPSDTFRYAEELKSVDFYTYAVPQNNPARQLVWTPVYLDAAGKGLMVTLSGPVYDGDIFKGVVSIDITTTRLSQLLESEYRGYLIDGASSVIASSVHKEKGEGVLKLNDYEKLSDNDLQEIEAAPNDAVHIIGSNYVFKSTIAETPWTMLLIIPVYQFIGKTLLFTLPVVFIAILLLITFREVTVRRKAEEKIRESALTDQLTGLKNRRYLDAVIETEMQHADRYKEHLSIINIDLDRFKKVNDTWGHLVGDDVLKHAADTIRKNIRKADVLVRLGGEEFMLLLPRTDIDGALEVAEKIRKALESSRHPVAGTCTASFGVAEKTLAETFVSLYKRADDAMYLAKERGRNCVVRYESVNA